MNQYGIDLKTWKQLLDLCYSFSKVNKIILYGSRARGDFRQGSDIDLAIDAPLMTSIEFAKLWNDIDDLPVLYTFDVVHLQGLTNKDLITAINHDGIKIHHENPSNT